MFKTYHLMVETSKAFVTILAVWAGQSSRNPRSWAYRKNTKYFQCKLRISHKHCVYYLD